MLDRETAVLALLLTEGAGNVAANRALACAAAMGCPLHELLRMPLRELMERLPSSNEGLAQSFNRCGEREQERARRLMARSRAADTQTVLTEHGDYPQRLRTALGENAPPLLFVHGDVSLLEQPCAAVVGARKISEDGAMLAGACAAALVDAGAVVVSGGAQGADMSAHEAALGRGGLTVVVLPQGILTWRMPAALADGVDNGCAALVSACPPDAPWTTHAAVTRNAYISALSRLACVVEPKKTGGSVRTARCALEHGTPVMVYAHAGMAQAERELVDAGAERLLDGGGQFSRARIEARWRCALQAEEAPPGQATLF